MVDSIIAGFKIHAADQARSVLEVAKNYKQPIGLRFAVTHTMEDILGAIDDSHVPVIAQVEVSTRADAQMALELGLFSFVLSNMANPLANELRARGAFVETGIDRLDRAVPQSIQAICVPVPTTRGAFTGARYILPNSIRTIIQQWPNSVITLLVSGPLALNNLRNLMHLSIHQLVFDVRPQDQGEVSAQASEIFSVLATENTAILSST